MNAISKTRKYISSALKLTVILCAAAGTVMSAAAGRNSFMGGSRVFMYFTIQSNIAVAAISAIGLFLLLRNKAVGGGWYTVKLAGAVSITLTGAVFTFVLAPTLGEAAWRVYNVLTHIIVPAAAVADFFVTAPAARIKRKNVIYVVVPPLLYAAYAGIGYIRGWDFSKGKNYPYFFLNWGSPAGAFGFTGELPFMGCVWWILSLLIFLIAVGWGYLAAADRIWENSRRKQLPDDACR